MKRKLLLITCIGILGVSAYGNNFTPERNSLNFKAGITGGTLKIDDESDQDTSSNISLNLEYIATSASGLEYGLGVGFSKINPNEDIEFRYVLGDIDTFPVYGLLRYKFDTQSNWNPYVFANLGYAYTNEKFGGSEDDDIPFIDIEGELYYACGIGLEYKENLSVEFLWSRSELDVDVKGEGSGDADADLFTLALGYRLDM